MFAVLKGNAYLCMKNSAQSVLCRVPSVLMLESREKHIDTKNMKNQLAYEMKQSS